VLCLIRKIITFNFLIKMKINLSDMERVLERQLSLAENQKGYGVELRLGCCIDKHKNCGFEYDEKGDKIVEFVCKNPCYEWQCMSTIESFRYKPKVEK